MKKNTLIKGSGDVLVLESFVHFIKEIARSSYTVVVCGGGSSINEEFIRHGFHPEFDVHGRITRTWEERKIARDILEKEVKNLEDKLIGAGAVVIPPILYAGSVLCHINGDMMVKALYLGFDDIFVCTLSSRIEAKKKIFSEYSKVQIKGF